MNGGILAQIEKPYVYKRFTKEGFEEMFEEVLASMEKARKRDEERAFQAAKDSREFWEWVSKTSEEDIIKALPKDRCFSYDGFFTMTHVSLVLEIKKLVK